MWKTAVAPFASCRACKQRSQIAQVGQIVTQREVERGVDTHTHTRTHARARTHTHTHTHTHSLTNGLGCAAIPTDLYNPTEASVAFRAAQALSKPRGVPVRYFIKTGGLT